MMSPPRKRWSWTQFTVTFLLSGFVAFLRVDDNLVTHLLKCLIVATLFGLLAGRFGDRAWRWITNLLRWTH